MFRRTWKYYEHPLFSFTIRFSYWALEGQSLQIDIQGFVCRKYDLLRTILWKKKSFSLKIEIQGFIISAMIYHISLLLLYYTTCQFKINLKMYFWTIFGHFHCSCRSLLSKVWFLHICKAKPFPYLQMLIFIPLKMDIHLQQNTAYYWNKLNHWTK